MFLVVCHLCTPRPRGVFHVSKPLPILLESTYIVARLATPPGKSSADLSIMFAESAPSPVPADSGRPPMIHPGRHKMHLHLPRAFAEISLNPPPLHVFVRQKPQSLPSIATHRSHPLNMPLPNFRFLVHRFPLSRLRHRPMPSDAEELSSLEQTPAAAYVG